MNDSTPMFPVHARPNRVARRFALSRRRQRKAQALILAVLVMLMVAVLSAGFLLVVSGNLNQTARVTDTVRAKESARSGLKFVNEQLTYSQLGENWRPGYARVEVGDNVPGYGPVTTQTQADAINNTRSSNGSALFPHQGDAAFDLYYSSVDKAQNWAGSFAKFPDPLAPRSDAPQYLARIQRVASTNPTSDPNITDPAESDSQDPSKIGMLRITVIGLSNDDPAAFSKTVAYKGGQSAPFGRFMRTVTNWDFKNNVVPNATVVSYDSAALKLTLNNVQGVFPTQGQINNAPFTVMIGNASVDQPLRGAVVQNVSADGTVLTLAADPAKPPVAGERVEVAAQIGASKPLLPTSSADPNKNATAVDFNLDGTIDTTNEKTNLSISAANTPGSIFISGSALLVGNVNSLSLEGRSDATHIPSNVEASGLIAQDSTITSPAVTITGIGQTGTAVSKSLVATSNDVNFPLGAANNADDDSLVADGAARIAGIGGSTRETASAYPPDIASGLEAERYRRLASARTSSPLPDGPAGIYINNPSDREKVWDAIIDPSHPKLRDMTQAELTRMWLSRKADGSDDKDAPGASDTTTLTFRRSATADPVVATNASLEQQHLRGWVGPDEFHARGALIELISEAKDPTQAVSGLNPLVAKVAITLDSRSDNDAANNISTNASGGVSAKAWKKSDGTPSVGVYRKVFDWPANGVIFAEGNARVRGEIDYNLPTATGAVHSSLTIVSQNNIYIDGSVDVERNRPTSPPANTPTPKLLLLARKNVVANPTQAVYRPDVQSTATSAATVAAPPAFGTAQTTTIVNVADINDFRQGDVVEAASPATPGTPNAVAVVSQAPAPGTPAFGSTPGQLTLTPLSGGAIATNDIIRTRQETTYQGRAIIGGAPITNVVPDPQYSAIQRRLQVSVPVDPANNDLPNLRLTFDHSADKVSVMTVATTGTPPNAVLWGFKKATDTASGNAVPTDKVAVGNYNNNYTSPSNDLFDVVTASDGETLARTNTVATVAASITAKNHPLPPPVWGYTAPVTALTYGAMPFHYLASLGNRTGFGATVPATPPATTPDGTVSLATAHTMLASTTIRPLFDGNAVALSAFGNTTLVPRQFGFSPNYLATASDSAVEDALTADEQFYQAANTAGAATLTTLDSRSLQSVATPGSSIIPIGTGSVSFYQPPSLFDTGLPVLPVLPQYRLGHMRMERIDPANGNVTPGYMMNINAFVYAQTGSWFVIPNALFNPKDFTSDAAGANTIFNNTVPDTNRNGQAGIGKRDAQLRYARANYRVNFFGAIAENQTAIVNPVGTVPGAVQAWSNDWATYNYTADAGTDPTIKPTLANPTPGVLYTFDPSYAAGQLTNDPGFVMPQTEELTYVE